MLQARPRESFRLFRQLALPAMVLSLLGGCSEAVDVSKRFAEYDDLESRNSLAPADGLVASGPLGGPFTPASKDYVFTNYASEDLDYQLESTESWVVLSRADPGTIFPGQSMNFTVSLDPTSAAGLAPGPHTASVAVRDRHSGIVLQSRDVDLEISSAGPDATLAPSDGLIAQGPQGGPFTPTSKDYVLTNNAQADLDYDLTATQAWVAFSVPASGTVPAQQSMNFTVSLDTTSTASLPTGSYLAMVIVREQGSATVLQQRDVELSIHSGGFGSPSLLFSTFLGGYDGGEGCRDVAVDAAGNIYIAGGCPGNDFPTTLGAYDRTYNTGGNQNGSAGQCDGVVAKFTPDGQLVWATYVGGINYDRFYSIEVHTDGSVYLSGRAGPGFPVTAGAFQPEYRGTWAGIYGVQNGVVVKLAADGSGIIWSSYVGTGNLIRDLDIDQNGDAYILFGSNPNSLTQPDPGWFATAFDNAYQKTRRNARETGVMKVTSDGSQVLWATWFGGNGKDAEEGSIVVDDAGRPYILFNTSSTNLATTPGVPGPSKSAGDDVFLARLSADGSALELGTYLGGNGSDGVETHGLAVIADKVVALITTESSDLQTTSGAYQSSWQGGQDGAVVTLSLDGALIASTYVGGSGKDETDGLSVTPDGHILYVGQSDSTDLPVTPDAHQSTPKASYEGYIVRLSPDLSTLIYCTYMGGNGSDALRAATFDGYDIVVAGGTGSSDWPTLNAHQSTFANGDIVVVKYRIQ